MTGVKFSEKIKASQPGMPVIISTGYSAQMDAEKAKEMGIAAFIMKPIVRRDIAGVIRDVLDRKTVMSDE